METNTPNTDNNVENTTANTTAPVVPTFHSTIKDLPIALAGETAKTPARTAMKFQSAELTMERSVDGKAGKTWIMIHVEGLSLPLFRNTVQAKADLSNYIDGATAEHLSPSGFEKAYNKHFRNKVIFGSVAVYDKGSVYIVDENSTAYKRKENPAMLGEELVADSAGVRIDGFLRASLTEEENDALYEAELAFAREQQAKINTGAKFSIS